MPESLLFLLGGDLGLGHDFRRGAGFLSLLRNEYLAFRSFFGLDLLAKDLLHRLEAVGANRHLDATDATILEVGKLLALGSDVRVAAVITSVGSSSATVTNTCHTFPSSILVRGA